MRFRRIVPALLTLIIGSVLAAPPAGATWSIVVTDSATGEVAVGCATCVNGLDLERYVPVIRVGKGAGAAQAQIDSSAKNRQIMWDELAKGTDPAVILARIKATDSQIQTRQMGIVDLLARTVTFSGTQTFAWAGGQIGTQGTLTYAIQGNILTGAPVVGAAKNALLGTSGDLAERLMAAMLAAQAMGGDGRCSCSPSAPTSCGAPPASFTKSAHVGFMVIARIGDTDGACTSYAGCATGNYYMDLNVKGNQTGKPDPVFQLQGLLAAWRAAWTGRPDHIQSQVTVGAKVLENDGVSQTTMKIRLIDWQGVPLTGGGALVAIGKEAASDGVVNIGVVTDHKNGVYTVPIVAGTKAGKDLLRVVVDDGQGPVTLYPFTEVVTAPKNALSASVTQVSTSQGDDVGLSINGGKGFAERPYLVLISLSGTSPGFLVGNVHVPLVLDAAIGWSFLLCDTPVLSGTCGALDLSGAASGQLVFSPNDLLPLVGGSLSMSVLTMAPVDYASDAVTVGVQP